jgi:hypothetical protein
MIDRPEFVTLELIRKTISHLANLRPKPTVADPTPLATGQSSSHRQQLSPDDLAKRIRNYLATIPPAVAGSRGHDQTFYVAGRLVRGFSLSPDEAYPYIAEYNSRCDPPWSEHDLRRKLTEAAKQPGPRGTLLRTAEIGQHAPKPGDPKRERRLRNFYREEIQNGDATVIEKLGRAPADIFGELLDLTCGYPKRVGPLLFAPGHGDEAISWMQSSGELFAWIHQANTAAGQRTPEWISGPDCITKEEFRAYCSMFADDYIAAEQYPHEPTVPKVCYIHPPASPGDGSRLADLLRRFSPATPEDEDLILAFFLTLFWGGPGGQRPLFIFEASSGANNQGRGAGKSTLATVAASLCGGVLSIGVNEDTTEIQKRLLGKEGRGKRVVLIDNVKSLRFSNPDIEGMIANEVISGRQMFVGEGSRPNLMTWVLTFNQPSVSKDFASRAVLIRIDSPVYDPNWLVSVREFIEANRWEIIGDIVATLRRPVATLVDFPYSRWSAWEMGVLARTGNAHNLQDIITQRRQEVDDDSAISEDVEASIRDMLKEKFGSGYDPDCNCVHIPNAVLFEKIVKPHNPTMKNMVHGSKWLLMLGIKSLSRYDAKTRFRGFTWRGDKCPNENQGSLWNDIPT